MTADNLSPYENDWSPFTPHDLTVVPFSELHEDLVRQWLRGLDVVLGAETFYKFEFMKWAREEGVRTVLQINPEFAPYFQRGNELLPRPDVFINPTTWMMDRLPDVHHLPCPVDRDRFRFRLRTEANHFVHIMGHRAMQDRAGTKIVIQNLAMISRKAPNAKITIRTQSGFNASRFRQFADIIHTNVPDPVDLYTDMDVMIMPRRYAGQCLTVNEALSCGIPVIMLNRLPEKEWGGVRTIPSRPRKHLLTQGGKIDWWDEHRGNLTLAVQELSNEPAKVEELSNAANLHAERISWNRLHPVWMNMLETVAAGGDVARVLAR